MNWLSLLLMPVAGFCAFAFGRRVFFWSVLTLFIGFWSLLLLFLLPKKPMREPSLPTPILAWYGNRLIARQMRRIRTPSDLF
jgi:hypothetical protein